MKKFFVWFCLSLSLLAMQDNPKTPADPAAKAADKPAEATKAAEDKPAEATEAEADPPSPPGPANEDQESAKSVSMRDLEDADEKLIAEREKWAKSERRLNMLLEDLGNRTADIESKTKSLEKLLDDNKKKEKGGPPVITQVQIDHWNSREAKVAAKDFILLYNEEPEVAIGIIKGMKKKKSAELIDAVSAIDAKGRVVASKLHESIGIGKVKE